MATNNGQGNFNFSQMMSDFYNYKPGEGDTSGRMQKEACPTLLKAETRYALEVPIKLIRLTRRIQKWRMRGESKAI